MYRYQVINLNPEELSEGPQGFLHKGETKTGSAYRFALITSDEKADFNRDREAAKIAATLKITKQYAPGFAEFKKMLPGVPVPVYFSQVIEGRKVFGWGYWMSKPEEEQPVLANISKIVSFLNQQEGKEPVTFNTPEDMPSLKDALGMIRRVAAEVAATGSKTTKDILDGYISQLGTHLSDEKLLEDITSFNQAARQYILDTGKYKYSIGNVFLIWLQADKAAKEFGSKPYWEGKGYQPKKDARPIFILKPSQSQSVGKNFSWIKQNKPQVITQWNREAGRPSNTPVPKDKEYAVVTYAMKNNMLPMRASNSFYDVAIFDDLNVEPIPGREQVQAPEPPKWFNDDNSEDEKAEVMVTALKEFLKDNGIRVSHVDDLGGAQGTSAVYDTHIKLLTKSPGAGILSTFIHEIAHQLLHSPVNKDKFHGKYYLGRDFTHGEVELHAEAIAYTVMKTYGFPIEHSINYIALKKQDQDAVKKYQKVIRDTSYFIIQQIETYGDKIAKGQDTDPTVGAPEEAPVDTLQEALKTLANIILEFKEDVGGMDLVAKVDALIAAFEQKAQTSTAQPVAEEKEESILEKYKVNVIQVAENKKKRKSLNG